MFQEWQLQIKMFRFYLQTPQDKSAMLILFVLHCEAYIHFLY